MTSPAQLMIVKPQNPAAPTLAELSKAMLAFDGAFIDVTAALKQANEAAAKAAESATQLFANYQTSFSFTREYPLSGRDFRQIAKRLSRACRRPALIHNGRKPR